MTFFFFFFGDVIAVTNFSGKTLVPPQIGLSSYAHAWLHPNNISESSYKLLLQMGASPLRPKYQSSCFEIKRVLFTTSILFQIIFKCSNEDRQAKSKVGSGRGNGFCFTITEITLLMVCLFHDLVQHTL